MKRMSHYDNEKIIFIHLTFVQIIYFYAESRIKNKSIRKYNATDVLSINQHS
jgi:hypothetical protein